MQPKITTLLTAALLISSTAFAGAPDNESMAPESLSNGFYVEPYLGYGYAGTVGNSTGSHGVSGGLALGYKFTDHWAVDAGYTQSPHANVSTRYFYTSLKYIFPFNTSWDVFAKLGPAYAYSPSVWTLLSDIGFTYWIKPNLGFVIQSAFTTRHNHLPLTVNITGGLNYFF